MVKDVPLWGLMLSVSVAMWAILKFLFKPFFVSMTRLLVQRAFRTELKARQIVATNLDALALSHAELEARLKLMEQTTERHELLLQTLPGIQKVAERSCEASERTEVAVTRMSETMLALTKEIGQLQGAQRVGGIK